METGKGPTKNVIDELENSKNEVLKRIADKLKAQLDSDCVNAGHSSHSSGNSGRTHTSTTSH